MTSVLLDWIAHARARWPNGLQRARLAGEYAHLRTTPLLLADLAIRNHVYSPAPDVQNLFDAGVAEGRRRAILELFLLARMDPQAVAAYPRAQADGERNAG